MRGFIFGGLIGGLGGILLGLILGAVIFQGFIFSQSGAVNVPYDQTHSQIANQITVFDKTDQAYLTLKHIHTGPAEIHPYAPMQAFTAKKTYTQSFWVWCAGNDIDISMTLWGAGDDGKTYLVSLGRHMSNAVEIKGFGYVTEWAEGSTQGHAIWEVTV